MISLLRIIRFAFQDMARNFGMSFMTVFILILMLLSFNTLWSVDILTKQAVNLVEDQINVSVYFNPAVQDKDVTEIKKYLEGFPEVTSAALESREAVLAEFQNRHKLSKDVLDALEELDGNPFGPTLIIKTKEPGDYKKIITALSVPEYNSIIDAKSYDEHQEAIERIQLITNRIEKVGLGLSILFALIAFLIIFNTVRVAIQTQRMEIGIKRLVGASNWFIRGPYLVEAFFFTIISLVFTVGLIYLALRWLDPYLGVVFPQGFSLTNYYNSHILYVFGIQAGAVFVLTITSSAMAMRRQLKV